MIYKWLVFHIYVNYRRVWWLMELIGTYGSPAIIRIQYGNIMIDWFMGMFIMKSPRIPSDKLDHRFRMNQLLLFCLAAQNQTMSSKQYPAERRRIVGDILWME